MISADYDSVIGMMKQTPGVTVRDADSPVATERYLIRNPGLSFVAEHSGRIIGCVMSGHDGRRGYLQHLIVLPEFRNQGIASAMVERCLIALEKIGILKTHIEILTTNDAAISYWEHLGWERRLDIYRYSYIRQGGENA
jgi:ribosomal protein S18 acetylase RimI-like enzyme